MEGGVDCFSLADVLSDTCDVDVDVDVDDEAELNE